MRCSWRVSDASVPRGAGRHLRGAFIASPTKSRTMTARVALLREAAVKSPVRSLVDRSDAPPRVARPERDEDPDEVAFLSTGELNDDAEGPLRRRTRTERQIDLRAASKAGAIRAFGLACECIHQRKPFALQIPARTVRDAKSSPGESAHGLLPDALVEPYGQAATADGGRHWSAFAVR